jgi:hypothetical protein
VVFNQRFRKHTISNERGQVAIFIALIFQVLFLFFAMVVNVGLLVHHKINLQNSVDLAAYYGAMKQAESLNAIAHINYQIRQSWKLLAWRYRELGTAGVYSKAHPYDKIQRDIVNYGGETIDPDPTFADWYNAPAFCITYVPFRPVPKNENTCKSITTLKIPLFKPPKITAPFIGLSVAIKNATEALLKATQQRCEQMGTLNYIMLGKFVTNYILDQAEKKRLMRHIAYGISDRTDDFMDLDGLSAREGMQETFRRNLSEPNRAAINSFKIYNGLGNPNCKADQASTIDPPHWLAEVSIFPQFTYTDTTACAGDNMTFESKRLDQLPTFWDQMPDDTKALVTYLQQFVGGTQPPPYNFSIGYEKNPWCMEYIGVSASTTPRIPFAPLGDITLTARAFAKPFGGKIGPWYGKRWPQTATESDAGDPANPTQRIDANLPIRTKDFINVTPDQMNQPYQFANYSKYPGDQLGLKSLLVLGQYARAIYNIDPAFRNATLSASASSNAGLDQSFVLNEADAPNFKHWDHVGSAFEVEGHGDMLAWDNVTRQDNPMRKLEIAAIAPDLFDITYYSIEPDYYNMYFKRIRDKYLPARQGYPHLVRSDLGSRIGDPILESFSVRDQMDVVAQLNKPGYIDIEAPSPYGLAYMVYKGKQDRPYFQLLTSWTGKSLSDYSLDPGDLGTCKFKPVQDQITSGACVGPGRTGYSVKLISSDYLKTPNLPLGGGVDALGGGGIKGAIKNPPENF